MIDRSVSGRLYFFLYRCTTIFSKWSVLRHNLDYSATNVSIWSVLRSSLDYFATYVGHVISSETQLRLLCYEC